MTNESQGVVLSQRRLTCPGKQAVCQRLATFPDEVRNLQRTQGVFNTSTPGLGINSPDDGFLPHLLPVLFVPQAALFLEPLKLPRHADLRQQGEDAFGQTLAHQLICKTARQRHQLSAEGDSRGAALENIHELLKASLCV